MADISLGAAPVVEAASGLVLRIGADTYALQVAHFEEKSVGPHGSFAGTWDDLVVTKLPGGAAVTLTKNRVEPVLPEEGAPSNEYSTDNAMTVTGLVGSFVSLSGGLYGFTGGVHDFDDSRYWTLSLPGGEVSELGFFEEVKGNLEARLVQEDTRRKAESPEEEPLPRPESLKNFGLALSDDRGTLGLRLLHNLECCSWAENHGLLALDVPLPKAPSALQASLRLSSDGAWVEAPDGCGAVSVQEGKLKVKVGKEGAAQEVAVPGASGAVRALGVYWIPPADAFKVAQLPKPIPEVKK